MRLRLAATLAGAVLFLAGLGVTYWPAALIVVGGALLAYGLLNDDGKADV